LAKFKVFPGERSMSPKKVFIRKSSLKWKNEALSLGELGQI